MYRNANRASRLSLRWRLLLLNIASAVICLIVFSYVSHFYKQSVFPNRLHLTGNATGSQPIDKDLGAHDLPILLNLFQEINNEGTLLATLIASLMIAGLTYSFSRSVDEPLKNIEQAVERFNRGDFSARARLSDIPEVNKLCITLNGFAARFQDIEQRRQEMMEDLSHELGTPLTVISGYLELVQDGKVALTPELQAQMFKESQRLNRLLGDLQVLSKVESGGLPLTLQTFRPTAIMQQLLSGFSLQCQQSGKTLTWRLSQNLPPLYADPDRFSQILTNLLSNAVRYTPAGGVITVSSRIRSQHLWIEISDTGIGLSTAEQARIFERFWRSPSARAIHPDGSGLGLAITKRLVELQGGTITADCQPGKGCTFRFSLPLA